MNMTSIMFVSQSRPNSLSLVSDPAVSSSSFSSDGMSSSTARSSSDLGVGCGVAQAVSDTLKVASVREQPRIGNSLDMVRVVMVRTVP